MKPRNLLLLTSYFLLISGCVSVRQQKIEFIPIKVKETGGIQGLAYESAGKTPISGVMVWAYNKYGYITSCASTDIHGRYIIRDLLPGDYILKINSGEYYGTGGRYAGEYYKNTYWWEDANLISVQKGKVVTGINFLLESGGVIRGKIIDARTEKPVIKIPFFLKAYKSKNSYTTYLSLTDSLGKYLITGIEPGAYKIYIEPDGWIGSFYVGEPRSARKRGEHTGSPLQRVGNRKGLPLQSWDSAQVVESILDTVSEINFEVSPGATISGKVTPRVGNRRELPLQIGQVSIQVISKEGGLEKEVDSTGHYIISGLPEGRYRIKLSPSRESPYCWQYYRDAISPSYGTLLSVTPRDTITGIDFQLKSGGMISGIVKDENEEPIKEFNLTLYTPEGEKLPERWAFHSPTGKYELKQIPPGKYRLKINSFDSRTHITHIDKYYKNSTRFKNSTLIEIKEGYNTTNIDFKLSIGGWVRGFIRRPLANGDARNNFPLRGEGRGEPLSSDSIKFKIIAYSVCPDFTNENQVIKLGENTFSGGYRITGLSPGEYKLCAFSPNSDFAAIWFGGGRKFNDLRNKIIKIEKGKTTEVAFNVTPGECQICGTIYDTSLISGKVSTSGTIIAYDSTGHMAQFTDSNDGSYKLKGLTPGKYFLRTGKFNGYIEQWYEGIDLSEPLRGECRGEPDCVDTTPWLVKIPDNATLVEVKDSEVIIGIDFHLNRIQN
ncbi:hypothetical protein KAW65_02610 [candidate division WOR-3 bacterium]|nr:hypothetical protein [candidate division WOR-3 bacterium]